MLQAVIYARYSTANQNPKSIDDQIAYCQDYINRQGGITVVSTFYDHKTSGEDVEREGIRDLVSYLSDKHKKIDYVVTENLDRLSRDPEQTHRLYKIFSYFEVKIMSVNEGIIDSLHIALKGTMNWMYTEEIGKKVMRSHIEKAKSGLFPASKAYGYKVKTDAVDKNGKRLNGVREIVDKEAKVVVRIFEMYSDGIGSKSIARQLNIEGIPSPTGGYWTSSTILGSRNKKSGILYNNIYRGKLVWNRNEKRRNPLTNKKENVIKPESEWITKDVPSLRIIRDNLWNMVQARLITPSKMSFRFPSTEVSRSPSNKYLSGLLYCGVCGGKYHMANAGRYVCGSYRTHRTCTNARGMRTASLLDIMFKKLEEYIVTEELFVGGFREVFDKEQRVDDEISKQLLDIETRIRGYEFVLNDGLSSPDIRHGLKVLREEKIRLLSKTGHYHPELRNEKIIKKWLIRGIDDLNEGYECRDFAKNWRGTLSLIVDKVVMAPIPDRQRGMTIEVKIAGMEGWAEFYRRITAKKATG